MTTDEALKELSNLRAVWDEKTAPPFDIRRRIDALYFAVCRKHLPTCKCRDRVGDAFAEIYYNLKKGKNMSEVKTIMHRGIVIWWKGKPYSASNITDEVALAYVEQYPQNATYFDVLPSKEEPKEETKVEPKKKRKKATT